MKILFLVAAVFAGSIVDQINNDPTCLWTATEYPPSVITLAKMRARLGMTLNGELPGEYLPRNDVPETFDARVQWGSKILPVRDQGSCGSCWAFALAETFGDRLEITGQGRGVMSPQDLVSCDKDDQGCNGGEFEPAWNWVKNNGITTEECVPYTSGSGRVAACPSKCKNGTEIIRSKCKSWKHVDVNDIQTEILNNGPVSVGFTVYIDFMAYKSGVYHHKLAIKQGEHAVLMIGWGVEKGTPYWLCQNSWGAKWGEQGHFKILRGKNECNIEKDVYAPAV